MRKRIVFEALPDRPRPMDEEEIRTRYGGCAIAYELCSLDCDCCDTLSCTLRGLESGQLFCEKRRRAS